MSLHRRLILRLGLGALIIAHIGGFATFIFETDRVDSSIVAMARREARAFDERWPGPLNMVDEKTVSAQLTSFLNGHQAEFQGHFLMVRVYRPDHALFTQASAALPPDVQRQIRSGEGRFTRDATPWHHKILGDKGLYLQVMVPITAPDDRLLAYVEGVYHVPTVEMEEIRERITSTVILVVAAVLVSALVLYPLIIGLHREQGELARGLLRANLDILMVLGSAIAKRDSDTFAHNFRVALYALGLAEAVKLPHDRIRELIKGAWLHDVGKIAIGDAILLKPGKLDEAEFAIMKTHVAHGIDILRYSDWLAGASEVVAAHHEKWDGSGYPNRLSGEDIPLNARIFTLADVFDALTSRRPYKEPIPYERALDMMARDRGRQFDPALFDLFIGIAPAMYAEFGGHEDEVAHKLLMQRGRRYFFPER